MSLPLTLRTRAPACWAMTALLVLSCGCASRKATLTLRSIETGAPYAQTFRQAYFARAEDGSYDVVLVNDDIVRGSADPGAPLKPAPAAPLRQFVHVRVLWRPLGGTRSDNPSATNASIDWFVLSDASAAPDQQPDLLHYGGAGFVKVRPGDKKSRVMIRNATLKPQATQGSLTDPVGPSSLNGSFIATVDRARVEALLADIRAAQPDATARSASDRAP